VLALEGAPLQRDKLLRGARPRRQHDVAHHLAVLPHAELEGAGILEEVGKVEELGHQLLDVGERGVARRSRLGQRKEEAVRVVEAAALQLNGVRGEGFHAQQPEEHRAG